MGKEGKKGSGGMVTHLPPVQKVRLQGRGMLDTGYWTLDSGLSTRKPHPWRGASRRGLFVLICHALWATATATANADATADATAARPTPIDQRPGSGSEPRPGRACHQ